MPVNIYPIGAITKGQNGTELAELNEMAVSGAVAISDDGIPLMNGNVMRYAVEYCKMLDIPVINHAEDDHLRSSGLMNEGSLSTKLGLTGNPVIAESTMIYRDLAIAEYTGGRIHIPHVTSAQTVLLIEEFKNRGVNVTAEVTPHHLGSTEEILEKTRRIKAVCQRHHTPLGAAAMQFPLAHPIVAAIIPGALAPEHVQTNVELFQRTIPADLWAELKAEGLLREDAPTPE